jgi:hypothetical protein
MAEDPCLNGHAYSLKALENSMFLVGDPFNRTYNPAKVKAGSPEAEAYDRAFKTAFLVMKKKVSQDHHSEWD